MILDIIYAIILGIVEGVTEWLPISSTAHLILFGKLFNPIIDTTEVFTVEFSLMSDVVIQLGAILAVVIVYFKKLYPFKFNDKEYSKLDKLDIWKKVIVSCLPVVLFGVLLDEMVIDIFYNLPTISLMLIIYGVIFILIETSKKKRIYVFDVKEISYQKAFVIGLLQILAIIPGTSRSGITIIGATLIGCSKKSATEYSFFLAIPIMVGATALKLFKYLFEYHLTIKQIIILLIATIVSFGVSLFVVKRLLSFIKKFSFKIFGLYRIILGVLILVLYLYWR